MPKPPKRPRQGKRKNGKRSRIVDPQAIEQARRTYCQVCGRTDQYISVHHLVKRSQGGGDIADNLVALCITCHEIAHGRVRGEHLTVEVLQAAKAADEGLRG